MPQKILLVQLRQLGDILLTTPVITKLKQINPGISVYFLCHKMGQLILNDNPWIERTYTYSDNDSVLDHLKLIRRLRAERFDAVVDFMNNPRSALLTLATGAPIRVGFKSIRQFAYTSTKQRAPSDTYIVKEKIRLLSLLENSAIPLLHDQRQQSPGSKKSQHLRPLAPFHPADALKPLRFLSKSCASELLHQELRVILSPTHRREARRWPLESYAALADELTDTIPGVKIFWLWGPGEEALIDRCISLQRFRAVKAPPTTFREMVALIANCDLFIGNSNGPSHVAVGADIPSLQLHGPTDGRSWCPADERHRFVQKNTMGEISVTDVRNALESLLPLAILQAQRRLVVPEIQQWTLPSLT